MFFHIALLAIQGNSEYFLCPNGSELMSSRFLNIFTCLFFVQWEIGI